MKYTLTAALAIILMASSTTATAQVLANETARYYLPTSTTFSQTQIDSFNSLAGYQFDIINGTALTYPDLQPVTLTWNGSAWTSATPVAITNNFTTLLMAGSLSHQATATQGANNPSVTIDWADITGVTQYRFRWRVVGGTWSTSTITGSQRVMNTLAYSTTYECQVRVYVNSTTQGEYTQTYSFTTPAFVPLPTCDAPNVTSTVQSNVITLQWSAVGQGIAYQVQARPLNSLVLGGTTVNTTTYTMNLQPNTSYEYQVRTNCTNAQTNWSAFSTNDTAVNAICTPPTGLYTQNNTFYWTTNQYAKQTQIMTRQVGTANWGGTTVTGNTYTSKYLWGNHEWRVRSMCYGTTNTTWTDWSYGTMSYFPLSMEGFDTELAYPNPANDVIHFNGRIVVQDLSGRVILQGESEVDVHQLADGLYIVNGKKHIIKH